MHKHSLFFSTPEECIEAENWILDNFDGIEDYDRSYNGTVFLFYAAYALSERQKEIIQDTLQPTSFLSEEL
jgi:hypothetical protein